MPKMNERKILDALNESRKSSNRYRLVRENYIGEEDELVDDVVDDVEEVEDDVEDVVDDAEDVVDDVEEVEDEESVEDEPVDDEPAEEQPVETPDVVDHVDDAHVATDTDNDPDYDEINVHPSTVLNVLDDVETAIDDMDAAEDDLFDVEYPEDEDDWDDEEDWEDEEDWSAEDELVDDEEALEDDVDNLEDDILDLEIPEDELEGDVPEITIDEAVISFSGGKKHKVSTQELRRRKKRRKGYITMANGKRRKMTAKEKKARKKQGKKLNRGTAKRNRAKVMKKRRKALKNSLWTNEQAFMTLMNGVLADANKNSRGRIAEAQVISVDNGFIDGNSIILESTVADERGRQYDAKFVITGRPNGKYLVTESADFFEDSNLTVGGKYHMNGNHFVFDTMSYRLKTRRGTFTESFKVVNDR